MRHRLRVGAHPRSSQLAFQFGRVSRESRSAGVRPAPNADGHRVPAYRLLRASLVELPRPAADSTEKYPVFLLNLRLGFASLSEDLKEILWLRIIGGTLNSS